MMIASHMFAPVLLLILSNDATLCIQPPASLKPDEIIRHCTTVIQSGGLSKTDLSAAFSNRCRAYGAKQDYSRALPDCDRAVHLDPHSAKAFGRRGWVRLHMDDLDDAIRDCDQAIGLDPNFAAAWVVRGDVYAEQGYTRSRNGSGAESYDQAIRDFTESLRLKPDGYAHLQRGWCYFQTHNYRAAQEDFGEAIRFGQGARAYYDRGWCYIRERDYEAAMADFDESIHLYPSAAGSYIVRAWLYMRQGEYGRAIRDYNNALRLHPDAETYRLRGDAHYRRGQYGAAILDLARGSWHIWVPAALLVCLTYVLSRRRKPAPTPPPADIQAPPLDEEPEPALEPTEPDLPPEDNPEPEAADLDILIRTGLRDRVAIGFVETAFQNAGIVFFVMDQNVSARQESGNIAGWWNVRVPRDREAEAREIIRSVEDMK